MTRHTRPSPQDVRGGDNVRRVLDAAARAHGEPGAVLALVVETEGSTYVDAGAMALFGAAAGQAGWLSGGCLEPEIARRAGDAARDARIGWLEIDTREDEDLLSGSALGCRGRLRIALLPLRALPGFDAVFDAWRQGGVMLDIALRPGNDGQACQVSVGAAMAAIGAGDRDHGRSHDDRPEVGPHRSWRIDATPVAWRGQADAWRLHIERPPEVLVLGGGPETPLLLPLLRELGWRTTLVERRERWRGFAALADRHLDATPTQAAAHGATCDAALVMHHNFELDREALDALAGVDIAFVGLLGPVRRREDLFRVLPAAHRDALLPRLRSPIGLKLGGQGPEAIALSIAAQLQAWRCGEAAPA